MLQAAQEMASKMKSFQTDLRSKTAVGESGGGMVSAAVNGAGELVSIKIEPSLIDPQDSEMMCDLIVAAVNVAFKRIADMKTDKMKEMTGGIDPSMLGIDLSQFQ